MKEIFMMGTVAIFVIRLSGGNPHFNSIISILHGRQIAYIEAYLMKTRATQYLDPFRKCCEKIYRN